ncbi:tRNA (adenosine(37)-N6)-threonylcarbamoyltransferase complex ATPase subunit type 1 TsaE [Maritimibacter sp. UBA3975]|uniref:tRNA (adenosine(37)-N6)-threonylcarbamoyltransferase complex ATPase subunit type 1 TsaE n=1 Tax=Maritimibacter sp. UBA3975 TaxID=1946833 RepID=UPI000C09E603|nr:tRNA (adenosine(37)-N6)-threonylcarbamoyltransferase complex ATPase subunit type 1 TsaE [Maritimibacter sp. UBA3975]MAM63406.1 tRNA (adenosine(37)-N6)-threonylcarbamoyltransferase complex ATPase subunit type 1 TsaE [Maritimibacter sp.]|tara:strand:- start:73944 stop:74441 length:498 start_codon:yes stop_codon:yes gene_type:complete
MIDAGSRTVHLPTPDATTALAVTLAEVVKPGDVFLLSGPIGAGKTHFARSLIQSHLSRNGQPVEDVPSPTFTLVQTYASGGHEIWHADLYRLTHPDEVEELGLIDAFDTAICLVEWPDRLGDSGPSNAVRINFRQGDNDDGRIAEIEGLPPHLTHTLGRFQHVWS